MRHIVLAFLPTAVLLLSHSLFRSSSAPESIPAPEPVQAKVPTGLRLQLLLTDAELQHIADSVAPNIAWAAPPYIQKLTAAAMARDAYGLGFPDAGRRFEAFARGGPWVHFPITSAPPGSRWDLSGGQRHFIPREQWSDEYRDAYDKLMAEEEAGELEDLPVRTNEWVQNYIYDELQLRERPEGQ